MYVLSIFPLQCSSRQYSEEKSYRDRGIFADGEFVIALRGGCKKYGRSTAEGMVGRPDSGFCVVLLVEGHRSWF
jgi:hypothetical protein